jgi:NurA-like 5'-3' nuclease
MKAVGGSDPIGRDTIFRISSVTKPITAAETMIQVEECKLRLDEPVDRLLPELAGRKVLNRLDGWPVLERVDDIVVVLNVEIREMQRSRALAEVDADTALIDRNRPEQALSLSLRVTSVDAFSGADRGFLALRSVRARVGADVMLTFCNA